MWANSKIQTNAEKYRVKNGKERNRYRKFEMKRFMTKSFHAEPRANAGAQNRKEKKGCLRDSPLALYRSSFINTVKYKRNKIQKEGNRKEGKRITENQLSDAAQKRNHVKIPSKTIIRTIIPRISLKCNVDITVFLCYNKSLSL